MWQSRSLGFLTALAVVTCAPLASAYSYWTCGSTQVKLTGGGPAQFYRHTPTIGTGTTQASAYFNGINRWNAVAAMGDKLQAAFTTTASTIIHGNGRFEAAMTTRSEIGGNNGLTKIIYNYPHPTCVPYTERIIEADVLVANDMVYSNPSEDVLAVSGRDTFLHEFGHVLGLLHYQTFNVMRVPQPRPHFGGPGEHIDVLPDDAAGGRSLYGTSGSHLNVLSSAYRRDSGSDTIFLNQPGTVFACSGGGGVLGVNATVGNNGTVNVTQSEAWYVSTNSTAYGGTPLLTWNNSTYNANSVLTILRTMTLPPLSVGTYRLFHWVDVFGQHTEVREDDNVAREALIIEVIPC